MESAIFGSHTFTADPFEPPLDPKFRDDSPCITHVPADTRTMDQLRTDLFTDLLLASIPTEAHGTGLENIHATIQVTVAATTLVGEDDLPAELDGRGPLDPAVARSLSGLRTGWTRLFLDPAMRTGRWAERPTSTTSRTSAPDITRSSTPTSPTVTGGTHASFPTARSNGSARTDGAITTGRIVG